MRFLIDSYRSFASRWCKRGDYKLEKVALSEITTYPTFDKVTLLLRREDGAEMLIELHAKDAENILAYIKVPVTPPWRSKAPAIKPELCANCDGEGYVEDDAGRMRCSQCNGDGRRFKMLLPPIKHDYEPQDEGREHLGLNDPPCRICGVERRHISHDR